MSSKMLIDAAHPEETRVVVVRGNRLEDFDYESATRKQLRGNIYLAKVTRVEPSLQAAFVDYGGNRHGFLAFNEIHPDYYQIPVADRQALLDEDAEEESKAQAEEAAHDNVQTSKRGAGRRRSGRKSRAKPKESSPDKETGEAEDAATDSAIALESAELSETVSEDLPPAEQDAGDGTQTPADGNENGNGESVESAGSEDALEELPVRTRRRRHYKIQEVIKRRQIILVQVVKEERGNKGAALTTYISLAGRYTVLMPNTARGGGISRKITNPTDRKRLRKIASDLEVALGMGLIIRTAGASRTKAEIKRDYEYLLRMWENIRDLTLQSTAPTLVYEEGNLIKRSIRDLYGKEIDSVLVSGDEAYKEAKGFMKLLMPSHAKNVQPYKEPEPIFVRHQIERQMAAIFLPHVTLKSGGYIVINQTEALVSVDVNSGKSTREHSIEDTALRTNLEAAEEVARQMRLRDLAGLLVIDFIDMEERRNNRAVERRLKDSLKNDRARIQLGRISHFGLMEMSRQRLRAGVLEGSTAPCTMCQGTGIVRSTESVALDILRTLEDTLLSEGAANLVATTSYEVALYILNQKRSSLKDIETRYRIDVSIAANDKLHGANFNIERGAASTSIRRADSSVVSMDDTYHEPAEEEAGEGTGEGTGKRPRRRRRRGRGGRDEASVLNASEGEETATREDGISDDAEAKVPDSGEREDGPRRPRRRGRRGGRRTRGSARARASAAQTADTVTLVDASAESIETPPPAEMPETSVPAVTPVTAVTETEEKPKRKPRRASAKTSTAKTSKAKTAKAKAKTGEQDDGAKKPAKRSTKKAAKKETPATPAPDSDGNGSADRAGVQEAAPTQAASAAEAPEPKPAATKQAASETGGGDSNAEPQQRRGGWWQRGA